MQRNIRKLAIFVGLPLAAIALAVFLLSWGNGSTQKAHAVVDPVVNMTLSSTGCVSSPVAPGKCQVTGGSKFIVSFNLVTAPVGGYAGYETKIDFSGAINYVEFGEIQPAVAGGCLPASPPAASQPACFYNDFASGGTIVDGPTGGVKPNSSPAQHFNGEVTLAGAQTAIVQGNPRPNSTYTGSLYTFSVVCKASGVGTITMIAGDNNTDIQDGGFHSEAANESLTINCNAATNTPLPTATNTPAAIPRMLKQDQGPIFGTPGPKATGPVDVKGDALGNIWLTRKGAKIPPRNCVNPVAAGVNDNLGSFKANGTNGRLFLEGIDQQVTTFVPKSLNPPQVQVINAFEFEVRFDAKLVCVIIDPFGTVLAGAPFITAPALIKPTPAKDTVNATDVSTLIQNQTPAELANWTCIIQDSRNSLLKGIARVACVHIGKLQVKAPSGNKLAHVLAHVIVLPMPELFSQIRPNQDNGIVAQILDQGCQLADEQGHPIPIASCEDADVTARFLEGDVSGPDCAVNVFDAQSIALRWGATKGSLLFQSFSDLSPSGQVKGDGRIDIHDLQFVFGRLGSRCNMPQGGQGPVNPKA